MELNMNNQKNNKKYIAYIRKSTNNNDKSSWHIDNLSDGIKKGQQEKTKQGFYPSKPPLGYYSYKTSRGKVERRVDCVTGVFIKKAFDLYARKKTSINDVMQWVKQQADVVKFTGQITRKKWLRIFRNPFYYGYFKWGGKLYKGSHKPLVSRKLWNKVLKKLAGGGK